MSFVEGFSKSIGSYLTNKAVEDDRAAREKKDYEWKLQKAKEMEDMAAKTKVVSVDYFEQGGKTMAQPVNAAGEPVGPPRLANPGEAERRAMALDKANREKTKDELDIEAGRFDAENRGKVLQSKLDTEAASRETSRAYGAAAGAQAEAARFDLDQKRQLGEVIKNMTPQEKAAYLSGKLPGRGGREGISDNSMIRLDDKIKEMGLENDPLAYEIAENSASVAEALTKLNQLKLKREMSNNPSAATGALGSRDFSAANSRFNFPTPPQE